MNDSKPHTPGGIGIKPGDYVTTPHNSSIFKVAEVREFQGYQAVRFENGTQWYDASYMIIVTQTHLTHVNQQH